MYRCDNDKTLKRILNTPLKKCDIKTIAKSETNLPKSMLSSDSITVADLFLMDRVYFSFCQEQLMQKTEYLHCFNCNHCSRTKRLPGKLQMCSRCGFSSKGKIIIFPQSLYKKGEFHKMAILDTKKASDRLKMPGVRGNTNDAYGVKPTRCGLEECMEDALGLMDPLAFLLGSRPRGAKTIRDEYEQRYMDKSNKAKDFATMMAILKGNPGGTPSSMPALPVDAKPPPPGCCLQ